MINFAIRITSWLNQFFVSVRILGILNTIKIFLFGRFSVAGKELTIVLPNYLSFVFRARHDRGVISHFYKEGYFIQDNQNHLIETIVVSPQYSGVKSYSGFQE